MNIDDLIDKQHVILEMSDWNMQEKFYELPFEILKAFHKRIKNDGIEKAWDWFIEQVDYDEENLPTLPVKFGKVNMRLDKYFLDWSQVNECMAEWDELFS